MNTLEALEAAKAAPGDIYELTDSGVTYWIRYLRIGCGWRVTSNDGAEPGHSEASILPQSDGWSVK